MSEMFAEEVCQVLREENTGKSFIVLNLQLNLL